MDTVADPGISTRDRLAGMPEDRVLSTPRSPHARLDVADAPAIRGLGFRRFRGDEDFPLMAAVAERCKAADQHEFVETVEDLRRYYRHLVNSDPSADMLFIEMFGELIGYTRVWWAQVVDGPRIYSHFAHLVPEWREKGIRRAMLRHSERRLREIAADHTTEVARWFESGSSDTERNWRDLLEHHGYEPVRYSFEMVRPTLADIFDVPLPLGLEVRPVGPEDYLTVWRAAREAFRDHWGFVEAEWTDPQFESWQEHETFNPELWQVAWDGNEVAGMVLNYISAAENSRYGRQRGYTETICVRRPWRRRGLARALIARSLKRLRQLGMTEAGLDVDAESPHGALGLYESLGYTPVKGWTTYRKPLDTGPAGN